AERVRRLGGRLSRGGARPFHIFPPGRPFLAHSCGFAFPHLVADDVQHRLSLVVGRLLKEPQYLYFFGRGQSRHILWNLPEERGWILICWRSSPAPHLPRRPGVVAHDEKIFRRYRLVYIAPCTAATRSTNRDGSH